VRPTLSGDDLERFRAQVQDYVGQFKLAPSVGEGAMVLVPKSAAVPAAVRATNLPPAPARPATAPQPQREAASEPNTGLKPAPKKTR